MTRAEAREKLQRYFHQSRHYLGNAYHFLREREMEKASEFLWGSIAEAVKAVALSKGKDLRSHRALWEYAIGLAKELDDPSLAQTFRNANSLHSNFYEGGLIPAEVAEMVQPVREAVGKLLGLIPKEALE